jgi:hypothetical protein
VLAMRAGQAKTRPVETLDLAPSRALSQVREVIAEPSSSETGARSQ